MIDKRKAKRFKLLCPKDFRAGYSWFLVRMIGYHPLRGAQVPPFKGDKDQRRAWKDHRADLVQHYAPRTKLTCGHSSRSGYCLRCAENVILEYKKMRGNNATKNNSDMPD